MGCGASTKKPAASGQGDEAAPTTATAAEPTEAEAADKAQAASSEAAAPAPAAQPTPGSGAPENSADKAETARAEAVAPASAAQPAPDSSAAESSADKVEPALAEAEAQPAAENAPGGAEEAQGEAAAPDSAVQPAPDSGATRNSAFVFIKTNALTDSFKALVREKLEGAGISILSEGEITGDVVDEKKLVDQHYYSIASKATLLKPGELNMPRDKFKEFAGEEWDDVLASNRAYNAVDACEYLGVGTEEIDALWQKAKDSGTDWVKLGGGFQCAKLAVEGKEPIFAFNGFFMSMRAKFTQPGPSIHYFVVEWEPSVLSWADFRGSLLGATDPAAAAADSLRGQLFASWEALGLKSKTWIGENGIHASASPVEALAERCNWLSRPVEEDDFGKRLLQEGLPKDMIEAWRRDPQVVVAEGKKGSLFDQLEDLDTQACVQRCVELMALQQ